MATLEQLNRRPIGTIRGDGSRPFVFPADASGKFTTWRRVTAFALIVFYLSLPWIKVGGFPAVFLDVAGRRFHLFGITLAAQDLFLLFFVITGLGFSLFFVTALLGRVWCGWACPQTVFLDHVYRRIERWIDGDAVRRRALDSAPLSTTKVIKRVTKHTAYVVVSAVITHLFLAYFVSWPEVWDMMRAAPAEHWGAFVFIAIATGVLYFNFAWFREQLCIVVCPYGRIQSALIDDHSLVIGYDSDRGEPRGVVRRQESGDRGQGTGDKKQETGDRRQETAMELSPVARPLSPVPLSPVPQGDCVDCSRCVQVCPTGIDIRQGLQMECIGCTACIDACNDVMTRLNRAPNLIRYDSQVAFTGGRTRWLRPRTMIYGILLLVGASVTTWALSTVKPAYVEVTRMTGAPYIVDEVTVRNQFLVRVVNKRNEPVTFAFHLTGTPAGVRQIGVPEQMVVGALAEVVTPLVLQQSRAEYSGPFKFGVRVEDQRRKLTLRRTVEFLGPEARLLREDNAKQ
jgi:polyferredoxin